MKLLESIVLHYVEHGEEAVCHGHPTKTDVVNRCVKELETYLNGIDWPAVGSDQLLAMVVKNLTNTDGSVSIDVTDLENPVTLGTLQLRDHAGVLEVSTDNGSTWSPISVGTAGDMLKSTYDTSDHGYVDQAAALKDGTGTLDADGIRELIPADPGDMLKSMYDPSNHGYVDEAATLKDGTGTLDADGIRALVSAPASAFALTLNPIHPTPSIEVALQYGNATFYIRSDAPNIEDQTDNIAITLHDGTPSHSTDQHKYGATSSILIPQGSYLKIDDSKVNPKGNDFIFMGWVFLPATGHQKILVLGNIGFQLATQYPSGGYLYCDTGFGDGTGTVNVCDSAWHHIAVLRIRGTVKVAVDGVEDMSIAIGAATVFDSDVLTIGNVDGGGSYGVDDGYVDDIFYKVGSSFYTSLPITPPGYIYTDAVFNGKLRFEGAYV
jgi:hypothetical protein